MANQKPLLTISLLISNRPETVRKCIESILPILEAIPSELILTDTSKDPKMNALCHEYTDQVYEFEWVKDFSKARNFGLEKAKGEWFMFLDDDEWFTDVQGFIDFFQSGEYKNYGHADYLTRNFYDPECTQYGDCWVSRMFRRDEDIRYEGIVHEIYTPVRGPKKYIHCMTHHIGYIFLTEEKRKAHSERNITLLFEQLKAEPTNLRWQGQLVLEYRFRADWEKEVSFCCECLEGAKNFTTPYEYNHLGTFYAGLIEGLFYLNEYEESVKVCQKALEDVRSTELAKALYHLRLAENYVMLEEWKKAEENAKTYLNEYAILNEQKELMLIQESALVVRYAFEELNIKKAYAILVCCDLKSGNNALLKQYYADIPWNLNYTVFYEKMTEVMVEAMATLEYDNIYVQVIKDACKKDEFKLFACAKAQEWEKQDDAAFQRLAHIFAKIEDEYWFFWYMKAIEEDIQARKYGVEVADEDKLLTISLLISNRPDTIRRCLDSLYQIRKLVPSELILIDTSKNPEIHEILLDYTDLVYEFDWCQDFAKARNEGLKRAKGQWFMFLDDDEWFSDIKELIEFFRSGEYKEYERANYQVRNFYDPDYVQYTDCWVSRLNRIGADSRFVGKVHEYMEPCVGKEKNISALAFHSGYIFMTEEDREKHAKRNIDLLKKALQEAPDNIRWLTQLAQEYRSSLNWKTLVSFCKTQIEERKDCLLRDQCGTFYAGAIEGLIQVGEYQESIDLCQKILQGKTFVQQENAESMLSGLAYICMAESYFELENWEKASQYASAYLELEAKISKNEEIISEQAKVLIVQHAFDPSNSKKAYSILICNDLKHGNTNLLHEYYDKLEWNEIVNYVYEKLPVYLLEAMPTLPYEPIFSQIITDSFKRDDFKVFMCREALKWEENDFEHFQKLAYIYAQAESDFWFIWYMIVVDLQARYDGEFLSRMTEEKWEVSIRSFVGQATEEQLQKARNYLQRVFATDSWEYTCFENLVLEKRIMDGPKDILVLEEYYETLKAYAQQGPFLEGTAAAAEKISAYIALELQDKMQALAMLKEAVDVCPDFAEGIGKFLHSYSELERQRVKKQRREMRQLRDQVMEQVRAMSADGQGEAALQIIKQLKQMFPDDLEVIALGLEVRLQTLE